MVFALHRLFVEICFVSFAESAKWSSYSAPFLCIYVCFFLCRVLKALSPMQLILLMRFTYIHTIFRCFWFCKKICFSIRSHIHLKYHWRGWWTIFLLTLFDYSKWLFTTLCFFFIKATMISSIVFKTFAHFTGMTKIEPHRSSVSFFVCFILCSLPRFPLLL